MSPEPVDDRHKGAPGSVSEASPPLSPRLHHPPLPPPTHPPTPSPSAQPTGGLEGGPEGVSVLVARCPHGSMTGPSPSAAQVTESPRKAQGATRCPYKEHRWRDGGGALSESLKLARRPVGVVPRRLLTQRSVHVVRFQRAHGCHRALRAWAQWELWQRGGVGLWPPATSAAATPQLRTYVSPASAWPHGVHDGVHVLAGVGGVWGR